MYLPNLEFPAVQRDSHSAPFFDAAARGELVLRVCNQCQTLLAVAAFSCSACLAGHLGWQVVSSAAKLVTWTSIHTKPDTAGATRQTVVGTGEFDEGPWLNARLAVDSTDLLREGLQLTIGFVTSGTAEAPGEIVPYWKLSS